MERLMDFLEANGFHYSESGVDVMRVTKGDITFAAYRMIKDEIRIDVGTKYVCLYLPKQESILFDVSDQEKIWSKVLSVQ